MRCVKLRVRPKVAVLGRHGRLPAVPCTSDVRRPSTREVTAPSSRSPRPDRSGRPAATAAAAPAATGGRPATRTPHSSPRPHTTGGSCPDPDRRGCPTGQLTPQIGGGDRGAEGVLGGRPMVYGAYIATPQLPHPAHAAPDPRIDRPAPRLTGRPVPPGGTAPRHSHARLSPSTAPGKYQLPLPNSAPQVYELPMN